jgi:hypothetical protein
MGSPHKTMGQETSEEGLGHDWEKPLKASIRVVGINAKADALALKEKLIQARRANAKKIHAEFGEKKVLVDAMAGKEASFLAKGMNQA